MATNPMSRQVARMSGRRGRAIPYSPPMARSKLRKTSSGRSAGSGGRVTPKGGRVTPPASARYTPPIPRDEKVSPPWYAALMFTLLGLGVVVILANYIGLLPGGAKNAYLLLGLGLITAGFIAATRYR